jgi:hypothetical protein
MGVGDCADFVFWGVLHEADIMIQETCYVSFLRICLVTILHST